MLQYWYKQVQFPNCNSEYVHLAGVWSRGRMHRSTTGSSTDITHIRSLQQGCRWWYSKQRRSRYEFCGRRLRQRSSFIADSARGRHSSPRFQVCNRRGRTSLYRRRRREHNVQLVRVLEELITGSRRWLSVHVHLSAIDAGREFNADINSLAC